VRTPTVNRDLPWAAIRREWETSPIDMTALARKYGVASTTTLTRRRVSEGWKRDPAAVEARQALADVISDAMAIEGTAAPATGKQFAATLWKPREERPLESGDFRSAPVPPRPEDAAASELDAEMLRAQRDLSHAMATRSQRGVALAIVVQRMGLHLAQRVDGVLQPPSEGGEDDASVLGDLQRLIRVNPDRETLASLATVAGKTIDLGQAMERRALADAASRPAVSDPSAEAIDGDMTAIINRVDTATAWKLRMIMLEIQQEQRATQIASAATPQ
jgi:hypothetical protein